MTSPSVTPGHQLLVNNSLDHSNERTPFVPQSGSNFVSWYICGPTVYDSSHLGHARNYLSFDIIRRILEDYFHYDVFAVMNITDIDDKIIERARRNHLLREYLQKNIKISAQLFAELDEAFKLQKETLESKIQQLQHELKEIPPTKKKDVETKEKEILLYQNRLSSFLQTLVPQLETFKTSQQSGVDLQKNLKPFEDALSLWLDKQYGQTVEDKNVFRSHAAFYEKEFMDDMKALNVRVPHVITRVSEYITEVIDYIQQIIKNGYAYEQNGSVYFDTVEFQKKFKYAVLSDPSASISPALLAEGEGSQTAKYSAEKKNANDFALWKKSRAGEPKWDSPWGFGRPGWHIECSAMASAICGPSIDIHCGGSDLKFPHHDNEIAQAEAYYQKAGWVQYWLHSGHLHIDGLKMSKSLKNFITIQDALKTFSPRQLRILFLLQAWDKVMNYSSDVRTTAVSKEQKINNFFMTLNAVFRQKSDHGEEKWRESETKLHQSYLHAVKTADAALKDNFNTFGAFEAVLDLISETNKYLTTETEKPRSLLLRAVATWVTKMLNVFGLNDDNQLGFKQSQSGSEGDGKFNKEEFLAPYIDVFAKFRQDLRQNLKEKKPHLELLELSDKLRDDVLPDLGIRFEDESKTQLWKFQDPQELKKEIQERKDRAKQKQLKSLENKKAQIEKELNKWKTIQEKGEIDYRKETDKYNEWDDLGIPTGCCDGTKVSKSQLKKLKSDRDAQKKSFDELTKKLAENSNFMEDLRTQLENIHQEFLSLSQQ